MGYIRIPDVASMPETPVLGFIGRSNGMLMVGRNDDWDFVAAKASFFSSTTFTVPDNVYALFVACGGGGGAGVNYNSSGSANWVAGAGGGLSYAQLDVEPGDQISLTVGKGGEVNWRNSYLGSGGGSSYVTHNGQQHALAGGGQAGRNSTSVASGGEGNVANGNPPPSRFSPGAGAEGNVPVIGLVKAGNGGAEDTDGDRGIIVLAY